MENELIIGNENAVSLMSNDSKLGNLIKPLSHEILLFGSYIAGTAYIDDKTILDELKGGDKLILLREPDNKFDENAVLVLDSKKRKLGYIPEKDNTVFARLMDSGKYLMAKVRYIWPEMMFNKIEIDIFMIDF